MLITETAERIWAVYCREKGDDVWSMKRFPDTRLAIYTSKKEAQKLAKEIRKFQKTQGNIIETLVEQVNIDLAD